MISLETVDISVRQHTEDLIALARQDAEDGSVAAAFDRLIAIFCGLATRPDAGAIRSLIRHYNAVLLCELAGRRLPLPASWPRFISLFGQDFVDDLAREGLAAVRIQIQHAVERDPLAVQRALDGAGLLHRR